MKMLSKDILQGLNFIEVFSSLDLLLQLLISFSLDLIKNFFNKFPPQAPRKKSGIFWRKLLFNSFSLSEQRVEIYWAQFIRRIYSMWGCRQVLCVRDTFWGGCWTNWRVSVKLLNQGMIVHVHFERDEI